MSENEQNEPIQDGSTDALDDEKLAGIIEQVRSDVSLGNVDDVTNVLRQRLDDAAIDLSEADFAAARDRIIQ